MFQFIMYISKYILALAWSGLEQFLEDHVIPRVDGDIIMSDLVSPKFPGSQLGRVTVCRHCVFSSREAAMPQRLH